MAGNFVMNTDRKLSPGNKVIFLSGILVWAALVLCGLYFILSFGSPIVLLGTVVIPFFATFPGELNSANNILIIGWALFFFLLVCYLAVSGYRNNSRWKLVAFLVLTITLILAGLVRYFSTIRFA